jgi:hypothetical protein
MNPFRIAPALTPAAIAATALASTLLTALPAHAANGVPTPDHVVVVILENHSYSEIIGSSSAPYLNSLANQGAVFTNSFAVEHPSEPNYLDLFSGGNQGVTDDSCPHTLSAPNLASALHAAGLTFGGYSEDMPSVGYTGCSINGYRRKHNPWVNFTNVPAADNMPFAGYFPSDFTRLPRVAIVVPNMCNDMHDCGVSTGDNWVKSHIDPYAQWAKTHNSLLIVTFDEDDTSASNHIATLFVGQMVKLGHYSETINHFRVLRTLEDMFALPYAGKSSGQSPITDCWTTTSGGGGGTTTPPAAPTGLLATAGNAQVSLTWSASSGATSYHVKRSTVSGSGYATVASPTSTSFVNTGLTNGATYYYVVSAVNSAGESANSSQASAMPTSGGTGGTSGGGGMGASLAALADSYIRAGSYAGTNYGTATTLTVKRLTNDSTSTYNRCAYLKFSLAGVTAAPSSAKLTVTVNSGSTPAASSMTVKVYAVADTSWTETGLTWNNAPGVNRTNFSSTGTLVTSRTVTLSPAAVTFDLTAFVASHLGQTVTLQLIDTATDNRLLLLNSREAASGRPVLTLTP